MYLHAGTMSYGHRLWSHSAVRNYPVKLYPNFDYPIPCSIITQQGSDDGNYMCRSLTPITEILLPGSLNTSLATKFLRHTTSAFLGGGAEIMSTQRINGVLLLCYLGSARTVRVPKWVSKRARQDARVLHAFGFGREVGVRK
ncbi:hypothetical protein PCH_Pc21g15610 [Penicillium rubens Wisconsin 54-1255]|uniref:Uncharacterized protein n=1 Tax=Penicillium rubens (strain ATCC 28089 / DSM 1075 / NRRL 1951 / Wisconsin 54-1255) TaxID=500485 RepID=B6HJV9_PENRW|nr:hypothetical protein PCH_Pc21g15610 [Penicillium rubens Wisconsin 54-1255]